MEERESRRNYGYGRTRREYEEIATLPLTNKKELVISQVKGEKTFTLGQRVTLEENGEPYHFFYRNAVHLSHEGLLELSDILYDIYTKVSELEK